MWYKVGTVSVTNGSTTVTGSGTDWVSGAATGEAFLAPDGRVYEISAIVSATQITLGSAYLGSTAGGQSYQILPSQSFIRDLANQAADLVNSYGDVLTTAGAGKFGDGTLSQPGVAFVADQDTGIRRTGTNTLALVSGGVDKVSVGATVVVDGTTIPTSKTLVTTTDTQTLTGKTIDLSSNTLVATSAQLAAAMTDESGTSSLAFTNSPTFTGTPLAPTAAAATNTTQIATTAFVRTEVANLVAAAPAALDTLNEISAALGNDANFATTVTNALAAKAPLASPGLTGTPTAPTAAAGTNSTQLATTAHVFAERSNAVSLTNKTLVDPAINGKADLVAIDKTLFPANIVDSFIYDTTKDTDGGAWRDRCSHTSWYKETLCSGKWLGSFANETAARAVGAEGDYYYDTAAAMFRSLGSSVGVVTEVFRGNRAGFPAKVLITASMNIGVVFWDLDNAGAMWMKFPYTTDPNVDWFGFGAALPNIGGVTARNGVFALGTNHFDNSSTGLILASFATDSFRKYRSAADIYNGLLSINIAQRTANTDVLSDNTSPLIVNNNVNDVAMTVLPGAPIDPETGLAVPTIAVATNGGVSVIRDDGTVVNISDTSNSTVTRVALNGDEISFVTSEHVSYGSNKIPAVSYSGTIYAFFRKRHYQWSTAVEPPAILAYGTLGKLAKMSASKACIGSSMGLSLLEENPAAPTKGMANYITNTYTSGWMNGDIRGAWLADATAGTLGTELVTDPGFDNPASWERGYDATITGGTLSIGANGHVLEFGSYLLPNKAYVVTLTATVGGVAYVHLGDTFVAAALAPGVNTVHMTTSTFNYYPAALKMDGGGGYTLSDVSVKLADPDRSVKANPLNIVGTLTKSPVAAGSQLMAYSGFSTGNYLEQPYSSNLDQFDAGDMYMSIWAIPTANSLPILWGNPGTLSACRCIYINAQNVFYFSGWGNDIPSGVTASTTTWQKFEISLSSTALKIYYNGSLMYSGARPAGLVSPTAAKLYVGNVPVGAFTPSSLALARVSGTLPSDEQVKFMYETERKLFEPGAQCLLPEAAVTAMDYDDATDLLHVTSAGYHTAWKDLVRVSSEASSTGALKSVAASGGIVSLGGSTGADLYIPAQSLRDELARQDVATAALGSAPVFLDFTATASQTAFVATQGYKILALYKNGTLMRESTTGVYWTRSTDGFKETATLSVGATVGDWVSLMLVRQQ